jgi:hypothetical protein
MEFICGTSFALTFERQTLPGIIVTVFRLNKNIVTGREYPGKSYQNKNLRRANAV